MWGGSPSQVFSFSDGGVETHRGGLSAQPHARGSTKRKHLRVCLEEILKNYSDKKAVYNLGNRDWYPHCAVNGERRNREKSTNIVVRSFKIFQSLRTRYVYSLTSSVHGPDEMGVADKINCQPTHRAA